MAFAGEHQDEIASERLQHSEDRHRLRRKRYQVVAVDLDRPVVVALRPRCRDAPDRFLAVEAFELHPACTAQLDWSDRSQREQPERKPRRRPAALGLALSQHRTRRPGRSRMPSMIDDCGFTRGLARSTLAREAAGSLSAIPAAIT